MLRAIEMLAGWAALLLLLPPPTAAQTVVGTLHTETALAAAGMRCSHRDVLQLDNGTRLAVQLPPGAGCAECVVAMRGNDMLRPSSVEVLQHGPVRAMALPNMSILHIVAHRGDGGWVRAANASARSAAAAVAQVSLGRSVATVTTVAHELPPGAAPGCDYAAATADALQALGAAPLSGVHLVATTLPWDFGSGNGSGTDCTIGGVEWEGLAYLGGTYSWTRAAADRWPRHQLVMFHELGHNWGLGHAGTRQWEYGDATCAMGSGRQLSAPTLNGGMLYELGWADATQLDEPGAVTLGALGASNDVLRLPPYVVSFRGGDDTAADAAVPRTARNTMYVHLLQGGETQLLHASNAPWADGGGLAVRATVLGDRAVIRYETDAVSPAVVAALGALLVGAAVAGAAASSKSRARGAAVQRKHTVRRPAAHI